jgi:hypothetical protein
VAANALLTSEPVASEPLPSEPMTDEQRKQLTQLAEEAMAEALRVVNPSHLGAQRIHLHGHDVVHAIVAKVRELASGDKFQDEEVVSHCGYVSGYRAPKAIAEQIRLLGEIFPGLHSVDQSLAQRPVPAGAEGWFALPRWEAVAPTYGAAVERVLAELSARLSGRLFNYREGKLGERYLRQAPGTRDALHALGAAQPGNDILIVAAQFGILHRGRSVRRALELMSINEFGLGAFAAGVMLLTHPERLQHYDDLWIDCAGDEYSLEGDGRFENAPYFGFYGGWAKFDTGWSDDASDCYGSATGFAPQED